MQADAVGFTLTGAALVAAPGRLAARVDCFLVTTCWLPEPERPRHGSHACTASGVMPDTLQHRATEFPNST